MLVLSRRVGESLIIGDNISVTVLSVVGHQVRIGITAPKSIAVHREEVYQRIHNESDPAPTDNSEDGASAACDSTDRALTKYTKKLG